MKIGNGKHEQNISQISEQKKKLQKDDHFYFTLVQNSYILEKRQAAKTGIRKSANSRGSNNRALIRV